MKLVRTSINKIQYGSTYLKENQFVYIISMNSFYTLNHL